MPGSDWRTEQRQIPLIRRRDFISPGVALLGQHFAPRSPGGRFPLASYPAIPTFHVKKMKYLIKDPN